MNATDLPPLPLISGSVDDLHNGNTRFSNDLRQGYPLIKLLISGSVDEC
jgi:hypothetical protein